MKSLVSITAKKTIRALGVGFGLLVFTLPLFSQANQGTIQDGVFDQTGGAIAGATVTVIDVARGVTRALAADSAGAKDCGSLQCDGSAAVPRTSCGCKIGVTPDHANAVAGGESEDLRHYMRSPVS